MISALGEFASSVPTSSWATPFGDHKLCMLRGAAGRQTVVHKIAITPTHG
jgi:hypothetical protein